MKKLLLVTILLGGIPFSMSAQDDDLYFVPKKKVVETNTDSYGMPRDTYYAGSKRSVDEYNRRTSTYEVIGGDSTKQDIIEFSAVQGVYPDSLGTEDFELTRQMSRFEDYDVSDNDAFWAGYRAGRSTWGWHSPWYYSRFGWYDPWYSPWYRSYYWGWYDPWYYGYTGWYGGWYDPWYYSWYGWGWGYPYHYGWGIPVIGGGGAGRGYAHIGTGTIRRDGSTRYSRGAYRTGFGQRGTATGPNGNSSLRRKMNSLGGSRSRTSARSGNGGNYRSSSSTYQGSRSSSSFGGGGSRSGGSFSGGGGSRSGGGGGSRLGGRR